MISEDQFLERLKAVLQPFRHEVSRRSRLPPGEELLPRMHDTVPLEDLEINGVVLHLAITPDLRVGLTVPPEARWPELPPSAWPSFGGWPNGSHYCDNNRARVIDALLRFMRNKEVHAITIAFVHETDTRNLHLWRSNGEIGHTVTTVDYTSRC